MSILQILKTRREEKASDIHDLARRVANGETVDPDRIMSACEAADMSDEAFMKLVDLIESRETLKRTAAEYEAARRDVTDAENAIAEDRAAFDKLAEQHAAAMAPIWHRLQLAEKRKAAAYEAEHKLTTDAMLPWHLRDAREQARKEAVLAGDALSKELGALALLERDAARAQESIDRDPVRVYDQPCMPRDVAASFLATAPSEIAFRKGRVQEMQTLAAAAKAKHESAQKACRDF